MPDTLTFDHYEVLTRDDGSPYELGRGAMGITYKAFDTSLRIPVALKVINATYLDSEVARQRFIREARSAAKLRHRHVASVFHLGIEGDAYFYAMEFIDGETVDALIKRQGPLPPLLGLQIAAQVARALNAAQPHGLVHRDIKPANLMLVREDDELCVKVIDFGLAKSSAPGDAEEASTLSMGGFVGTPHFASPEQLEEKEIDVRSDIYSLGVTLWYMLSGHTPFAGSMAQVMSQHLSKAPPFERLGSLPPPVAALLRRMLEKNPGDRPQTPADLRREIEQAIEDLAEDSSIPLGIVDQEQNFATILDEPLRRAGQTRFEPGEIVADRYRIVESLGETNSGRAFRAEQIDAAREVRLLVLGRELTGDAASCTQIEREVERSAATQHPNLLQIHTLETVENASFIVMEWTRGFSLLEALRARRELGAAEVLALLPQAADGIDHALTVGLKRLDLALHQVFIHFPSLAEAAALRENGADSTDAKNQLLRQPVDRWPAFVLKLNPLGITRELSLSETWAGRQTIVGTPGRSAAESPDERPRYIQALAAIVYELLGGTLLPFAFGAPGAPRYTPLATLSERGNDVLRRALDPQISFATAYEFFSALSAIEDLETPRREVSPSVSPSAGASTATDAVRSTRAMPPPPPPKKKVPFAFFGGLTTVAIIALGIYFLSQPQDGHRGRAGTPPPHDEPPEKPGTETELTSDPTPSGIEIIEAPPSSSPMASAAPVAPPPPAPPTRQDLLRAAMDEAAALESAKDWPKALAAWLKIAKEYPETDSGKTQLELVIEQLRARPESVNAKEFPALRELIVEAAQLDVVGAMMFLGEALRKPEPVTAFNWFSAAAAKGQLEGLTQVGLLLSNGVPERDLAKAVACFKEAADKGHPAAKTALAECYFSDRKGVAKDEKRAIALLEEAVEQGDRRAMDALGACYHQGRGVPQNFDEAARLFTRASDLGHLESHGNLAVLYITGEGVKQNHAKALDLIRKGSNAGDGYCMYLLARCLESGTGIGANALQAQAWYKKAAEAGSKPAADWCRKNSVPFLVR